MNLKLSLHQSGTRQIIVSLTCGLLACVNMAVHASVGTENARRAYDRGNYAEALKQLQPLADSGDASAQVLLGSMYANGKGVMQDDVQAAAWYLKAASTGDVQAQTALGSAYADGRGVPMNQALADYWQWKASTTLATIDKGKLDAEIAKLPSSDGSKNSGPVIDVKHCQDPVYRKTGYGYHHNETLQMLFLVDEQGRPVEVSLLEKTNWATLDHDFLVSYSKTCTFKPATKDGKAVDGLYKMSVTWTVDP